MDKIYNPKTNKFINLKTKKGVELLEKYTQTGGGSVRFYITERKIGDKHFLQVYMNQSLNKLNRINNLTSYFTINDNFLKNKKELKEEIKRKILELYKVNLKFHREITQNNYLFEVEGSIFGKINSFKNRKSHVNSHQSPNFPLNVPQITNGPPINTNKYKNFEKTNYYKIIFDDTFKITNNNNNNKKQYNNIGKWYTQNRNNFSYRDLKKALREDNITILSEKKLIIHKLLKYILYNSIYSQNQPIITPLTVYHGGVLPDDIPDTKSTFYRFKYFLSTSKEKDTVLKFLKRSQPRILLKIIIDNICIAGDMKRVSNNPGEEEVLFPPYTLFKITKISQMTYNEYNELYDITYEEPFSYKLYEMLAVETPIPSLYTSNNNNYMV